jgi:hypothetical protein
MNRNFDPLYTMPFLLAPLIARPILTEDWTICLQPFVSLGATVARRQLSSYRYSTNPTKAAMWASPKATTAYTFAP